MIGIDTNIIVRYLQGNADFVDYLIAQIYRYYGCQTTFTFDRKAAKHDAFTLLSEMD